MGKMNVYLCDGCFRDLQAYYPYTVPINIIRVHRVEDCDNHKLCNGTREESDAVQQYRKKFRNK